MSHNKLAEDNIKVTFEKKSGLTDQLQLYGNDESNGPDMYLYAHDSLGTFAEMGILAPITDVISEDVMSHNKPASGTGYPYNYLLLRSSVINPPLHPH